MGTKMHRPDNNTSVDRRRRCQSSANEGAAGPASEAEVDARRALLSRLQDTGKYNPTTARYVMGLADILVEQGRYAEAEQLTRVAVDINRTVGLAENSQVEVTPLAHLAGILRLERKNEEATRSLRRSIRRSPNGSRSAGKLSSSILAHFVAFTHPASWMRASPRQNSCEAAGRPRRRKPFRRGIGARNAGHRADARRT